MPHRLGIDIGKTFTDLLLRDDSGTVHALKTANSPGDPASAIAGGIRELAAGAGVAPGDIATVVHGVSGLDPAETDGPAVGLLVTAGFEHVLLLGRGQGASPLAGRIVATLGIDERMEAGGQVRQPIDEARARDAIQTLRDLGATAIAVSLLHAAANPAHERALKALIGEIAADMPVVLSSDVVREAADYERTVAAVSTAVLRPALTRYFEGFADTLHTLEAAAEIRVARADGGSMSVAHAGDSPVDALNAGPAAGVAAAAVAAAHAGCRDALALDMGGGASTIGIVLDGAPVVTRKTPVAGANLTLPSIAVLQAGAGGGAAVRITSHGALRVGPEAAAGGPACFGGDGPTLTDANLVLGLIPAGSDQGSAQDRAPDRAAAEAAIARLADRLGVNPYQAAQAFATWPTRNCMAPCARLRRRTASTSRRCRWSPMAAPGRCTAMRSPSCAATGRSSSRRGRVRCRPAALSMRRPGRNSGTAAAACSTIRTPRRSERFSIRWAAAPTPGWTRRASPQPAGNSASKRMCAIAVRAAISRSISIR